MSMHRTIPSSPFVKCYPTQAIAALPLPLREALVMRDVNGLSYRDIAEATGAPIGTVMSRLARGRGALAKSLKAEP
jgi:RNA polymerase sigma-70 factor, ECF subfamily